MWYLIPRQQIMQLVRILYHWEAVRWAKLLEIIIFCITSMIMWDVPEDDGRQCVALTDINLGLKTKQLSDISNITLSRILLLASNSLTGTIPNGISTLTSLIMLDLHSNYLNMGEALSVPVSTFSNTTLDSGMLDISENCLVFKHKLITVNATHCLPSSSGRSHIIIFVMQKIMIFNNSAHLTASQW